MNDISIQLKQNRLRCHLTQRELAQRSGVAYGTLRRLESTGQGSLKDYFQLQSTFNQIEPQDTNEFSRTAGLPDTQHRVAQRVRKQRNLPVVQAHIEIAQEQQHLPLSKKLALDFPYDWSNPNISEEALIAKVLDKARFMDVSRVFAYFGHARVNAVAQDFSIDLEHGVLAALMPGIERGARYA